MTKKITKTLRKLFTRLLAVISIFIVLFVLLLSIFKLTIPYWIEDKARVTEYIESFIGGSFDYKKLNIDWGKFNPVITIEELEWKSSTSNIFLSSHSNEIIIDVWNSILSGHIQSKLVELNRVKVNIKVEPQVSEKELADDVSRISYSELLNGSAAKQLLEKYPELLNQEFIKITDVDFSITNDVSTIGSNISLLRLEKVDEQRQLIVDAGGGLVNKLRFVFESQGEPLKSNSTTNLYTNIKGLNGSKIQEFLTVNSDFPLVRSDITSWINTVDQKVTDSRIEIKSENDSKQFELIANFSVNEDEFEFVTERFILQDISNKKTSLKNASIPHFNLSRKRSDNNYKWRVLANKIPVDYLSQLSLPLMQENLAGYIGKTKPKGLLEDIDITIIEKQDSDGELSWQPIAGRAKVSNFSITNYQSIPKIALSNISLWKSELGWSYLIEGGKSELIWKPTFIDTIPVENIYLAGSINTNDNYSVVIDNFTFKGPDAVAKAFGKIVIEPSSETEKPPVVEVNLYAEGTEINVGKLYRYWPRNGFNKKTLEYLDSSLVGGKVDFAKMVWRGPVSRIPYLAKQGQFSIEANVSNTDYKFEKDWPMAKALKAKAYFINEGIKVYATEGDLLGSRVKEASAIIQSVKNNPQDLSLLIKADANHESFSKIYLQSPLKEILPKELLDIRYTDDVAIDLKVDLLIGEDSSTNIDGSILFDGQKISGIPYSIDINKLKGKINFTEDGAKSEKLKATLFDNPIDLQLKVGGNANAGDVLQINIDSNFDISKALTHIYPKQDLAISGASNFKLHYRVDDKSPANESLIIRSDLLGTEIQGPTWISKDKQNTSPLLITLMKNGTEVSISSIYKNSINAKLKLDEGQDNSISGLIALGALATETLPIPDTGVAIEGYFDNINVGQWLNTFKFSSNGDGSLPHWISHINVTTPSLIVAGQEFTNVRINDEKFADEQMRFNLYSEQAKGHLTFFENGKKRIGFDNLNLTLKPFESISDTNIDIEPRVMANWQLDCSFCQINGINTGKLSLSTSKNGSAIVLKGNSQVEDYLTATIDGVWENNTSNLAIKFATPNSGKLLAGWGFGNGVEDTKANGDINLSWPGGFHQFELSQLSGKASLNTDKGVIKELSDKQARIFSVFSLQSIRRRLSLDFSDLFSNGFFYDEIKGRFTIKDGVLNTDKVEILGTSADVNITGSINMLDNTVNQKVLVTPKLGSSLPLLAGWALEPTTGVIMFLINKIFEPVLDVVVSIEYKIEGTIEDPKVIEVAKKSKKVKVSEEAGKDDDGSNKSESANDIKLNKATKSDEINSELKEEKSKEIEPQSEEPEPELESTNG